MRRVLIISFAIGFSASFFGCENVYKFVVERQPSGDETVGITYYIGGAGPIGNIGSFDVPGGLRDAGYKGRVEIYTWQSWTHAGDQINLRRNYEKAADLADEIRRYRRRHPDKVINIIALSAGTGIATFALEFLPEDAGVNNVVFLGCSLSSRYDLTRAVKRINDRLYVLHSKKDFMLKDIVWYTGTVDRSAGEAGIAGLEGFQMPDSPSPETVEQYQKVQNVAYRSEFAEVDYKGGHTGATARLFVRYFIAPALLGNHHRLLGDHPDERYSTFLATMPEKDP